MAEPFLHDLSEEEIEAVRNSRKCPECDHALVLHEYKGGDHQCRVRDCECWI